MLYAASDGLIHGNMDLADIFYLIAAIVFFIVAFIRLAVGPPGAPGDRRYFDGALVSAALGFVALGLLVT